MGAMRGEPVPVVKCKTIDAYVPADAEYVLEGFLDARGHAEPEGPYGEYCGYYGVVKRNPLFHLTAITRRKDALFQTVTISGQSLARTDTSLLNAARAEVADWSDLADEQVLRSQLRRRVFRAILALPAIYRAPVMLRDIQGMSTEEASAMLRVKDQTLKSRLHRGRLILRKQLSDFAGGLSMHRPIYGT